MVEQPGLDTLRRFGYGDIIDSSRLAVMPRQQKGKERVERKERKAMEKQQQERERRPAREKGRKEGERKESQSEVQEGKVKDIVRAKEPEEQAGSESRSRGQHRIKDPPPHSTIKLESESPS